ncbi:MAG: hypothetical protein AMXMBFR6_24340 [Betaproteobacteria bacterium]
MVTQPPQTPRTTGRKAPASTANKPKPPSTRSNLRKDASAEAAGGTTQGRRRAPAKVAAARTSGLADAGSRTHYIAEAAYYLAERRGFCEGSELDDWLCAEAEIDRLLASGAL